jgi:hypothetical protein
MQLPLLLQQVIDVLRTHIPETYFIIFGNQRPFPIAIHPPSVCAGRLGESTLGPAPIRVPGIGDGARLLSILSVSPGIVSTSENGLALYQAVLAKLLGFSYGLRLANRYECGGDGFFGGSVRGCNSISSGDTLSIMGTSLPPFEPFFDFSSVHRADLGWTDPGRVATVDPRAGQAGIFRLGATSASGFPGDVLQEIRIPIDGGRSYSIAFQPPVKQPRLPTNLASGVVVNVSGDGAADGSSQIVNMHPEDTSGLRAALDCSGGQRAGGIFADDQGFNVALHGCLQGQPNIQGGVATVIVGPYLQATAVNAADFDPDKPLTPGQVITIFGSELGETATSSSEVPLLGGTSVSETDEAGKETPLGLTFTSPGQINGRLSPDVRRINDPDCIDNRCDRHDITRNNTTDLPAKLDLSEVWACRNPDHFVENRFDAQRSNTPIITDDNFSEFHDNGQAHDMLMSFAIARALAARNFQDPDLKRITMREALRAAFRAAHYSTDRLACGHDIGNRLCDPHATSVSASSPCARFVNHVINRVHTGWLNRGIGIDAVQHVCSGGWAPSRRTLGLVDGHGEVRIFPGLVNHAPDVGMGYAAAERMIRHYSRGREYNDFVPDRDRRPGVARRPGPGGAELRSSGLIDG